MACPAVRKTHSVHARCISIRTATTRSYRIHGTTEPLSIGKNASSGCIRMVNQDVVELDRRVPIGSRVVVLAEGV